MPKKTVTETRLYPIILHREGDAWGYFSPEFGGGGAATFSDALRLAQELLDGEVSQLTEAGEPIPEPYSEDAIDADGGKRADARVVGERIRAAHKDVHLSQLSQRVVAEKSRVRIETLAIFITVLRVVGIHIVPARKNLVFGRVWHGRRVRAIGLVQRQRLHVRPLIALARHCDGFTRVQITQYLTRHDRGDDATHRRRLRRLVVVAVSR